MRTRGSRRRAAGFTLLELIIALSLSTLVLIGVIQAATSIIAFQLDTHRRGAAEGYSLIGALQLVQDLRGATYLRCPPPAGSPDAVCSPTNNIQGNILAGCTNWSTQMGGTNVAAAINPSAPNDPECPGGAGTGYVKSFYYCTPAGSPVHTPGQDARLIRYTRCGTTCSVPVPGVCGGAVGGATMSILIPAVPGYFQMDNINYYYERADDVGGAALHFIVGIGTPTVQGQAQAGVMRNSPVPVSYKYNMRVGMLKSYNMPSD